MEIARNMAAGLAGLGLLCYAGVYLYGAAWAASTCGSDDSIIGFCNDKPDTRAAAA